MPRLLSHFWLDSRRGREKISAGSATGMKNLLLYCVAHGHGIGAELLEKATANDGEGDLERQSNRGE